MGGNDPVKGDEMAQRTEVLMTCDVHEGDADAVETVTFTVEGTSYEFELCDSHLAEFREATEIWASHSRPVGRRPSPPRAVRARRERTENGPSTAELREWARTQGISVGQRGRLPDGLRASFDAAH